VAWPIVRVNLRLLRRRNCGNAVYRDVRPRVRSADRAVAGLIAGLPLGIALGAITCATFYPLDKQLFGVYRAKIATISAISVPLFYAVIILAYKCSRLGPESAEYVTIQLMICCFLLGISSFAAHLAAEQLSDWYIALLKRAPQIP